MFYHIEAQPEPVVAQPGEVKESRNYLPSKAARVTKSLRNFTTNSDKSIWNLRWPNEREVEERAERYVHEQIKRDVKSPAMDYFSTPGDNQQDHHHQKSSSVVKT